MLNIHIQFPFYLFLNLASTNAFIPHPLLADGVLTSSSITHTEITGLGFIRSLARFFYDTRINQNNTNGSTVNEETYFTMKHTIDELYELAYPEYSRFQIEYYSLPLKFILDNIMTENVLVDFKPNTKILSAAHFDSEAFSNGSRRIIQLRKTIINNTRDTHRDLTQTRELLGQALHTLQDFYSHSNWIEMGNTDINDLIGVNETIGSVAAPDQATCTNNGCTKIEKTCTLWQEITLGVCPLIYYDCQNNILSEINSQQLLTSGYLLDQRYENNDTLSKPTNVEKCSHGSILDSSSHIPAIGGINKDSDSLLFSPHSDLHKQAVNLAVKATERFLNDLRRDIGDTNFNRLFAIFPTRMQCEKEKNSVSSGKRFRFFQSSLSTNLEDDGSLYTKLQNVINSSFRLLKSIFNGRYFTEKKTNQPSYDLSDKNVNITDVSNFRSATYVLGKDRHRRKKRLINLARKRR